MFNAVKRKRSRKRLMELASQIGSDRSVDLSIQSETVTLLHEVLYESTNRHFPNDGDYSKSLYLNLMNLSDGLEQSVAKNLCKKFQAEAELYDKSLPSTIARELVVALIEASQRARPILTRSLDRNPSDTLANKDVDFFIQIISIFRNTLQGQEAIVLEAKQRFNPNIAGCY